MQKRPKIALVGRPNVGKSALFNRICKKKVAIVDDLEGVTRDRLYHKTDFFGRLLEVIDTGGIGPALELPFQEEVTRQTEIAIEEADSIIMVVDGSVGVTALDEHVARLLLRHNKPLCLAINKMDDLSRKDQIYDFYSLGISKMVAVSAAQSFQIAELLETALEEVAYLEEEEEEGGTKIAIIGRPNVGKSTLINYLLKEERSVVSPVAGTTRDSIDAPLEIDGATFTLIDTAGVRRKSAEHEVVDKFAAIRTERAIERADICLLLLDAEEGLTAQDKRVAASIEEQGKAAILLFNKWDKIKGFRMEHCLKALQIESPFLKHCPTLFISAQTGRNIPLIFPAIRKVEEGLDRRVSTGQLNKFLERAMQRVHPPMIQGKRLRIYYMAQIDIHPPRFVLFVNIPELMVESYKQYLINQFREEYGFVGVPLFFSLKGKKGPPQTILAKMAESSTH